MEKKFCVYICKGCGINDAVDIERLANVATKDMKICNRIINPGSVSTTKEACIQAVKRVLGNEGENDGECRFDSDCESICEGNVLWKQGCNARSNTCEKIFDTHCGSEIIADLEFEKLCDLSGCQRNSAAITTEINRLTEKWKKNNEDHQRLNQLQLESAKLCISTLEDVTNLFLVKSALLIASPLQSLEEIGASTTIDIIEKLNDKSTPPEELIAHHCKLENQLTTDMNLVIKKRDLIKKQIDELHLALS